MAPLDSRTTATAVSWDIQAPPQVSGILVRALAETVMRFDVPAAELLQGEWIALATRAPLEVRVPLPTYGSMLRRAIELTGEPAVALLCGLDASDSAFDLLAPLVSHVATLRHAIAETNQFEALAFEGSRTYLTESAGIARLRCEFPRCHDATDRSLAEFLVGGLMRMFKGFGGRARDLHAAYFEHERPLRTQAYAKIFRGRERFREAFTGLEFAAHLLDRPHLHANAELQSAAHVQAEQHLTRLARPACFVERLKTYLLHQPGPGLPDMTTAARDFGMSVRSLRRRMAQAELSYRALTQQMHGQRACLMLRNPNLTVQGVAGALGFADTGAFQRAFRRWTGMSAWQYRHSLGNGSVAETTPQ